MDQRTLEPRFFLALLLGTLLLVFLMFRPYLGVLVLAGVLAVVFEPLYARIHHWLKSPSLAAFLATLIVLALVLMPLTLFGYQLIQEAAGMYGYLSGRAAVNGFADLLTKAQVLADRFAPGLVLDNAAIVGYLRDALQWFLGSLGFVFAGFARILLAAFLMLLVFFYLVRDGHRMKQRLLQVSPLSDKHEAEILTTLTRAVHSVVRGQLLLALIQGLLAGIGFTLFGVPNPALWAGILMIAAFVPTFGTALVQIPVIIFMLLAGHTSAAVGLAVWGGLAVGMVDNVLGPQLISRGTRLHPLLTLFAVLGGIGLFGPIGLLLGPIILSLLFALLSIYAQIIRNPSAHSHT